MPTEKDYNIMIDVETGGLYENQHCILQVGAVIFRITIEDKIIKLVQEAEYQSKVNPNKELGITLKALELNGLNIEDLVENGKEEREVYNEVIEFMEKYMGKEHDYNSRIWAHNHQFDAKFMGQLARRCKTTTEKNIFYDTNWLCTQQQFRYLRFLGLHEEASCKLSNILNFYGLEPQGTAHDALSDASNAVRVLECIMNHQKFGSKYMTLLKDSHK